MKSSEIQNGHFEITIYKRPFFSAKMNCTLVFGYLFFFLGILLSVIGRCQSGSCSPTELSGCLSSFEKYKEELQDGFFPDHDLSTMKGICRDWSIAESCLDSNIQACPSGNQLLFEGLKDSYDFMCQDENLQTYDRIRSCLGRPEVHNAGVKCNYTFVENLPGRHHTGVFSICRAVQEYVDCLNQVLNKHCGNEAAEWQTNVTLLAINPLYENIGCFLELPKSAGTIGEYCDHHLDCSTPFSMCKDMKCVCVDEYTAYDGHCTRDGNLGGSCISAQCVISNSVCSNYVCRCKMGFRESGGTCVPIYNTCTASSVARCSQPFKKYEDELEGGFFPDHSLETMTSICSDWRSVESCLDDLYPQCNKLDKLRLDGLKNSYDFVCSNRGLTTYGKIRHCLGQDEVHEAGKQCNTTFTRNMQYATRGDLSALCRHTQAFLNCVYRTLERPCGQQAAEWQLTVDLELLTPLSGYARCTLMRPKPAGQLGGACETHTDCMVQDAECHDWTCRCPYGFWSDHQDTKCEKPSEPSQETSYDTSAPIALITGISVAILAVVVIAFSVILYCCLRKKARRSSHRAQQGSMLHLPPAEYPLPLVAANPSFIMSPESHNTPPFDIAAAAASRNTDGMAQAAAPPSYDQSEEATKEAVAVGLEMEPPPEYTEKVADEKPDVRGQQAD